MSREFLGVRWPAASDIFTIRRAGIVLGLTAAWCALWGSVSAANIASGVIVSSVASFAGGPATGGIRVAPLLRLLWVVAVDLAVSTGVVVREVLTPTDYTDEAIIAVPVSPDARNHLLLLYIAITVTPGTAVVAGETDSSTIYLHVLHLDRSDEVVEHVHLLVSLATAAFPMATGTPLQEAER